MHHDELGWCSMDGAAWCTSESRSRAQERRPLAPPPLPHERRPLAPSPAQAHGLGLPPPRALPPQRARFPFGHGTITPSITPSGAAPRHPIVCAARLCHVSPIPYRLSSESALFGTGPHQVSPIRYRPSSSQPYSVPPPFRQLYSDVAERPIDAGE